MQHWSLRTRFYNWKMIISILLFQLQHSSVLHKVAEDAEFMDALLLQVMKLAALFEV